MPVVAHGKLTCRDAFVRRQLGFGRNLVSLITGLLLCTVLAHAQTTVYWDTNGTTSGAGSTPTGTWSTSSSNKNWNSSFWGTSSTAQWTNGNDAVFSAGFDATSAYTVTVSGTVSASSITSTMGSPTLTGGTINLSDSTPDITTFAGSTLTINSGLTGSNGLNKSGGGTLIFGSSDKSYTGTTSVSAGTLQFDFNQTLSVMDLSGGTLRLNSATTSITTLNVTGNSTIDFASSAATLNLTNLSISAGVTLNIINWALAADYFYTANWTGATQNTMGSSPMNQITFNGFTASQSGWDAWDNQIRPNVPEPASYGALLLGSLTAFFGWKRRKAGAD